MKSSMFVVSGVLALAACTGQVASSDPQTQTQAQSTAATDGGADGKRPAHHHGPPPAAFEACVSKAAGDTCSVKLHDETLAGKCVTPPAGAPDTRLVCRPDKMPEGHGPGGPGGPNGVHPHGPPPPEVFTACEGKAADAACTVQLGDRALEGTCRTPPAGVSETRLGCAPSRD